MWNAGSAHDQTAEETSQTERFLEELDGLSLAIEQMAAYASSTDKSIADIHQEFSRSFRRIVAGSKKKKAGLDSKASESSTMSLATVWDLQFSVIRGTMAGEVLGLLSLLSPDTIPNDLFTPDDDWDEEVSDLVISGVDKK